MDVFFDLQPDQGSARSLILQPEEGFIKKCSTGGFTQRIRHAEFVGAKTHFVNAAV